ncbi:MAG TPA: heme-binding protein [Desulfosporosinus sp.]|nr:heme-binding protein [Desulfosporosinus sp.]
MRANLSTEMINSLARKLEQNALTDGGPPVSIAIYDENGFMLYFAKMDGAPLRSIKLAGNKAYSSSRMGTTTASFYKRLCEEKIDLSFFCDPCLTPIPGGASIIIGHCLIGAVGISGRRPEDDQKFADMAALKIVQEILKSQDILLGDAK